MMSALSVNDNDKQLAPWFARLLAVLLALGGCFWGLLLSPWMLRPDVSPAAVAVFGPGYLITLGYIIRSVSTPPLVVRRLIWSASIIIQGSWLAWTIWAICEQVITGHTLNEPSLPTAWWVFATAASVVGLLAEGAKPTKPDLREPMRKVQGDDEAEE
jgi:hypothetical protein